MHEFSNEEIAQMVQKGETESFALLMQRFERKLLRYASKFLIDHEHAQDLVQEVFIKAYTKIQSYNSDLPFSPWIYRIAHNEFINAIKKRKTESLSFLDLDTFLPFLISSRETDTEFKEKELKSALDTCLNKLDVKYREPLLLYYYEEMDYKEIAEVLHIPVSTVGVRLNRGKQMLKKHYEELYGHK